MGFIFFAAVRLGNLVKFLEIVTQYTSYFQKDGTISLVARLKKNVVLTALKQISVVYSRIRLVDIRNKLQLDSVDDVQCIVANVGGVVRFVHARVQAIRDGVIDARIEWDETVAPAQMAASSDAQSGWYMRTNEPVDVYATSAPQQQFNERTKFCLELHNVVTRALRYPVDTKDKAAGESVEEQREREAQELELAKELADDDDDDDF
jgi:26S proteasome regulatory subunit N3